MSEISLSEATKRLEDLESYRESIRLSMKLLEAAIHDYDGNPFDNDGFRWVATQAQKAILALESIILEMEEEWGVFTRSTADSILE